mmetsp:Transcript_8579/g.15368  ORF Transcript_8579/g.15368 Transcript_8579/m.15368 type:complete len:96 (+) Transcript_8579:119-406(+)
MMQVLWIGVHFLHTLIPRCTATWTVTMAEEGSNEHSTDLHHQTMVSQAMGAAMPAARQHYSAPNGRAIIRSWNRLNDESNMELHLHDSRLRGASV